MGREIADGDHDGKRTSKTRRWGIYPENLCGGLFPEWGCPLKEHPESTYHYSPLDNFILGMVNHAHDRCHEVPAQKDRVEVSRVLHSDRDIRG